ncbi:acetyltransferase domain-containing protein, putative [Eimeria praecox]|uniref:Acetyltransferase domain-containing protein, putative n=1 Tax=Eimeria praecox TaxID=51316 RepID=U6GJB7_9EIME|nr:acetyltransferase domain-containing protein, putative [Eimeria praecox]
MPGNNAGEPVTGHEGPETRSHTDNGDISSSQRGKSNSIHSNNVDTSMILQGNGRRGFSSCASEPQLWRSVNKQEQEQKEDDKHQQPQPDYQANPRLRRRSSSCHSTHEEAASANVVLREACSSDASLVRDLMKSHLRSLILPAVFYWLCRHAQDFGSFLIICCCFVPLDRMLMSLCCFLLLLLVRVVLELEQYAARGCPDLAEFDRHYLQAERNRFWVAEVRLVVSPGSRGAGVGSRLLSYLLRWRMALDGQGRPVEPKADPASTVSGLHSE